MDYFDPNNYDEPEALPEGFAWEDMEVGIHEKMKAASPPRSRRWWPLFALLFLGTCGSWISYERWTTSQPREELAVLSPSSTAAPTTPTAPTTTTSPDRPSTAALSSEVVEAINPAPSAMPSRVVEAAEQPVAVAPESSATVSSPKTAPLANNSTQTLPTTNSTTTAATTAIPTTTQRVSTPATRLAKVIPLPGLAIEAFPNQPTTLNPEPLERPQAPTLPKSTPSNATPYFSAALLGGVQNWNPKGTNNNKDYVSGFPGFALSTQLQYHFRPRQSVRLAYQYQRMEELFRYQGLLTRLEWHEDVLVKEVVNSLNGNRIDQVTVDTFLEATTKYNELKYNTYHWHNIHLAFHQELWNKKKSSWDISLGATYLFALQGKGKRLDEEWAVVAFDQATAPIFRAHQLAVQTGISYRYTFASELSLLLRAEGQQFLTNWDTGTGRTRPFSYGLMIGLQKKF